MATTVSFFKVAWNLLKMQGAGGEFNRQRANEQKFEKYQIPKHELHWVYDADNSIQRRILPKRTIVALQEEVDLLSTFITTAQHAKNDQQNIFLRMRTPSRYFTVAEDREVNNDVTQLVYNLSAKDAGHEFVRTKNLGHNVFRHAVFSKQWVEDLHVFF